MKLKYMGKYSGKPENIPLGERAPENVTFREPITAGASFIYCILLVLFFHLIYYTWTKASGKTIDVWQVAFGILLSFLALFPHQIIHALFFKSEVRFYSGLRLGLIFVSDPEEMSKLRFILMTITPSILFGFIPLILFFIFPNVLFLGVFGFLSVHLDDCANAIIALFKTPKGERIYIHSFFSYWYISQ